MVKLSNGVALFDVGEGTLAQLHRSFPEIEDVLGDLNFIFISHLHADHCVGAFNVLKSWIEFNHKQPKKLCVVCPVPFSEWIKEFASIEGTNLESIYFIDCKSLLESPSDEEKKVLTEAGLSFAKTVRVTHSRLSFGIVMKDAEGFKVTYSGDCRPSVNLVNEGMDSDLLIHEATFDDEKFEEALSKNHSTIGEAIQVGRDMKAKHLLLTHFSQRYPILPPDCDVSRDDGPIIGFAFDLMKVHMKDFWKWKYLAKAFQAKILKE